MPDRFEDGNRFDLAGNGHCCHGLSLRVPASHTCEAVATQLIMNSEGASGSSVAHVFAVVAVDTAQIHTGGTGPTADPAALIVLTLLRADNSAGLGRP